MFYRKAAKASKGLTMVEMLVIMAIISVLALIALPALNKLIPSFEVRSAARGTATLMQQARLLSKNAQKPIRVVVDCRKREADLSKKLPCVADFYMAEFDVDKKGELLGWSKINATGIKPPVPENMHLRQIGRSVSIFPANGTSIKAGSPNHVYWAVFFPSGRMVSSHEPLRMMFTSNRNDIGKDDNLTKMTWELFLNETAGRVTVKRLVN